MHGMAMWQETGTFSLINDALLRLFTSRLVGGVTKLIKKTLLKASGLA